MSKANTEQEVNLELLETETKKLWISPKELYELVCDSDNGKSLDIVKLTNHLNAHHERTNKCCGGNCQTTKKENQSDAETEVLNLYAQ